VGKIGKRSLIIQASLKIVSAIQHIHSESNIDPCVWIIHDCSEFNVIRASFPDVEILDNYNNCRLLVQDFESPILSDSDHNDFDYLNQKLSVILEMMNRYEGRHVIPFVDRIAFIYAQAAYWRKFLIEKEIELIVQFDVPHDVYDYIMFFTARDLGIKTVYVQHTTFFVPYLNQTKIINVITPTSDLDNRKKGRILDNDIQFDFDFEEIIKSYDLGSSQQNSALFKRLKMEDVGKKRIFNVLKDWINKIILYVNNNQIKHNYVMDFELSKTQYLKFRNFFKIRQYIKKKTYRLKKFYNSKSSKTIPLGNRFVFVPLHYQPERSTCPDGGVYSNPYLFLQNIVAVIPNDIIILVKEHPRQFNFARVRNQSYRSEFIYEQMLKHPNVRFIDTSFPTNDILAHSQLEGVFTVKGNIILEAWFNDIPVFYFGETLWGNLPNVYCVNDPLVRNNITSFFRFSFNKPVISSSEKKDHFIEALKGSLLSFSTIYETRKIDQNDSFFVFLNECLRKA
jgi:hypothetical protein